MARYIKVNPKVAKFLHLESDRNTVKDGNYLLWQADMLAFGPLTQLSDTLAKIGGISLLAHEAREEQDGTVSRPLPQASDERFAMPVIPADSTDDAEPKASGERFVMPVIPADSTDGTEPKASEAESTESAESAEPQTMEAKSVEAISVEVTAEETTSDNTEKVSLSRKSRKTK